MIKKATIDLKLIREKLHRNLVALIQFPNEEETLKALRLLTESSLFVGIYNDDCYGLEKIEDLEFLYEKKVKYRIEDIKKKYKHFPNNFE